MLVKVEPGRFAVAQATGGSITLWLAIAGGGLVVIILLILVARRKKSAS